MLFRLYSERSRYFLLGVIFVFLPLVVIAQEVIPGEYIVTYGKNTKTRIRERTRRDLGLRELKHFKLFNTSLLKSNGGRTLNKKLIKDLISDGTIIAIEPNIKVKALATPNDPKYNQLWGMNNTGQSVNGSSGTSDIDIDAPEAWDLSTGSSAVVVAVLDTGVLYTHPDLASNMWVNTGEVAGNGVDDDGNGVIDDVYGLNAITNGGDPKDDNGHGTHCAGTIAGVGNNGVGVVGVGWNTKIMALKFLDSSGSGSLSDAIQGIQYAVLMKQKGVNIKVLSNSWGGGSYSASLENAINTANSNGILFVAAAGNEANDNDSNPSYPANYNVENVVSVAAIDSSGNLASFSNYGVNSVHVAAPGVNILSTYLNNTYAYLSGTSMATPHVSGIAALVMGSQSLTPAQTKSKLMSTVKSLSSLQSTVKSGGLVSVYRALSDSSVPLPPESNTVAYSSSAGTYTWDTDLGTKISTADDGYTVVSSSFNFSFYGTDYNRFAISGNGRIQPLAASETTPTTDDYLSNVYKGINVYNMDLMPSNRSSDGGIWFKDSGDSIRITWVSMPYDLSSTNSSEKEIRVSAVLKSSGEISLYYNDTFNGNSSYDYGKAATVSLSPISTSSGSNLIISSMESNESMLGNQKSLYLSSRNQSVFADVDGDAKSDLVVWRPSEGMFYISPSSSAYSPESTISYQLGLSGDIPKTGDIDGDKKSDLIVFRPSTGTWYFRSSSTSFQEITSVQWGLSTDIPLLGDIDADGVSDLIVYRQSASAFYVLLSSAGFNRSAAISGNTAAYKTISLGGPSNDPVIGDADGDGAEDIAVVWQLIRFWTAKKADNTVIYSLPWGEPGDTPMYCKMDEDRIADRMIIRVESNNTLSWYAALGTGAGSVSSFGSLGDSATCKYDADGDGLGDMVVFRNNSGMWYLKESSETELRQYQFGLPGDIPLLY